MEVAGPECELVEMRRVGKDLMHLVYDTDTRTYYYQHRRSGINIGFEYAGTVLADAIAGFDGFCFDSTH